MAAAPTAPGPLGRTALIPNGVLGMLMFVIVEVMFFAGLISAFTIVEASAPIWPPPDQPRLPALQTAFNTLALLASGPLLWLAGRRLRRGGDGVRAPLLAACALGAVFVVLQGREWVALIGQGLTLTSSTLGSFFYLIIGMHGLHALVAIVVLALALVRLAQGRLSSHWLAGAEVFWYFVVGIWPFLYAVVYW